MFYTKNSTLLLVAKLVHNVVKGKWYIQMRARAPLDQIATWTGLALSWANVIDQCNATVEAYLVEATKSKFSPNPIRFND